MLPASCVSAVFGLDLTPASIPALAQAVLGLVIAVYLVLLPRKTRAVRRLVVAFLFVEAYLAVLFVRVSTTPEAAAVLEALEYPLVFAAGVFALGFVYRFLVPLFEMEERIVLGIGATAALGVGAWFGLAFARGDAMLPLGVVGTLGGLGALWMPIVALRKASAIAEEPRVFDRIVRPAKRSAQAHRDLAKLSVVGVGVAAGAALRDLGVISQTIYETLLFLLTLAYLLGFVVVFTRYTPQPTTFMAKVVGSALAVVLAALGVAGVVLYTPTAGDTMPAPDGIRALAALILAATALLLTVFPLFLRSSLVIPLRRLLDGVRRVNGGALDISLPVDERDEVGRLSEQFNQMTAALAAGEARLRAYADQLEERVQARTVQLQNKNEQLESTLGELKTTQARLVQQEKLASLGSLTAGIAHEIKNPLNFVTNFADLTVELTEELDEVIASGDEDEIRDLLNDLKENARRIREHGARADSIVRGMMDHARGGSKKPEPAEFNALVEQFVGLAWHGARARHPDFHCDVTTDLDPDVGRVTVHGQDLGRVLINIVTNAMDAARQRRTREGEAYTPEVAVRTRREGDTVWLEIADNGGGIPPEVLPRIFEPFYTTKPTGQGNTGLGLSLSYDIVTGGHGGTLDVASGDGRTTFTISLPAPVLAPEAA